MKAIKYLGNMWKLEGIGVSDLRRAERIKSLLKAKIVFNNRMATIDCVIKNISGTGAKVAVNNSVSIPNEFELEVPMKGKTYRAQLRWRDSESIGVEFLDAPEVREGGIQRVQHLQSENMRLKTAVIALSKKLEDLGQDVPKYF